MTPKEREKQRLSDMADVLKTEQGRRVVWALMDDAGLMSRIPAVESGLTQRALGKREAALDLHDWVMAASPSAFLKMLEQRAQEMEKDDD